MRHIWKTICCCQRILPSPLNSMQLEYHWQYSKYTYLVGCRFYSSSSQTSTVIGTPCGLVEPERKIGLTEGQQIEKIRKKPVSPANAHVSRVAIIGAPNAGKSTLANKLLGWRFAAVSGKVHTTRSTTLGIYTEGNTQLIFLDTPGMITTPKMKKHSLEKTLLTNPHSSLFEADTILVVVDVSTPWGSTRLDKEVLKALHLHNGKKSVLVLNKVDKVRVKKYLLQATRTLTNGFVGGRRDSFTRREQNHELDVGALFREHRYSGSSDEGSSQNVAKSELKVPFESNEYSADLDDKDAWRRYDKVLRKIDWKIEEKNIKGWSHFDRVFMLVAKDGDGIWDLKRYLIDESKPGEWKYDKDLITTQMPMEMARQCIWEKCMDHLPHDVPYKIEVRNKMWEVDDNGMLRAVFAIECNRSRQLKNVIGRDGDTIKQIAIDAKQALMDTFRLDMSLKVYASLKSDR